MSLLNFEELFTLEKSSFFGVHDKLLLTILKGDAMISSG